MYCASEKKNQSAKDWICCTWLKSKYFVIANCDKLGALFWFCCLGYFVSRDCVRLLLKKLQSSKIILVAVSLKSFGDCVLDSADLLYSTTFSPRALRATRHSSSEP